MQLRRTADDPRFAKAVERTLPHNLEAERSVLGAILLHNDALPFAVELLQDKDFYRDAHRRIYAAMLRLSELRRTIDLVTLKEELGRTNELDEVGGPAYISALIDGIPRGTNVEHYSRIVRDKALLRELIYTANDLLASAYAAERESLEILGDAEATIYGLAQRGTEGALVGGTQMATEGMELLERLHKTGHLSGVLTGLTDLDGLMMGLHKAHLVIVAARPGRGKSALALHLARHIGMTLQQTVAVFSLEMSREELILRMLSTEGRVNSHFLRSGQLSETHYARLGNALGRIGGSKVWVDDTPMRTPLQIRSQCRRLKAKEGLSCIVIDYLQLMTPTKQMGSREQEVASMAWACKMMSKELAVPVVLLSQLNRAAEERDRPQLRDLRESGAIEQHADDVLFVHPAENGGTCDIIVAKQRNGGTGPVPVGYDPSEYRFWNLAQEQS